MQILRSILALEKVTKMIGVLPIGEIIWREKLEDEHLNNLL
jgi:hypothetical protein